MTLAHYTDEHVRLYHGDCIEVMRQLPDASVDAVVTDPPYGLEFMGKEWDAPKPSWDKRGQGEERGFKGKGRAPVAGFDSYMAGYPFQEWAQEWATEALRVLKPGGHLLAFGGTRTWHRLACAIEDAGFEVRDSIAWMYGSGFPKSLDVSKAMDKAAGAEREVVGVSPHSANRTAGSWQASNVKSGLAAGDEGERTITAPATPLAQQWQGWGTALKPAFEPVVWARKPFSAVPLWQEESTLHHMIGAVAWLCLSPAKRAELSSPSSLHGRHGGWCVSARVAAATDTSHDGYDATDTFSSPEAASTFWSIASSWSDILGALSDPMSTSTTSTRSSTTTDLRTLFSLLAPLTSPSTMPACDCLTSGSQSDAPSAELSSTAAWESWLHTLSASVPETAIEPIARVVASALALAAEPLSGGQEAASSAAPTATTGADARGSAFEPVVVARKPLVGTVAANVEQYGTGALNIDGARIEGDVPSVPQPVFGVANGVTDFGAGVGRNGEMSQASGRWPANVILDESQAAELDRQSGVLHSQDPATRRAGARAGGTFGLGESSGASYGDTGGASRFFYTAKADSSERPSYVRQGSGTGRVTGLGGKVRQCNVCETRAIESGASEPSCGHGDYRWEEPTRNTQDRVAHPTVKPLTLMRYLVRLVTPPGGVVLEPFAGSGTTVEACIVEGFRCIAIEREADYIPLIMARITKPIEQVMF